MILYKSTKTMICILYGDTDSFDIGHRVRQGDTSTVYLLAICEDYVLRMSIDLMKEKYLTFNQKARRRLYPTELIKHND